MLSKNITSGIHTHTWYHDNFPISHASFHYMLKCMQIIKYLRKDCNALVILLKTTRRDLGNTRFVTIWSFPHNRPLYSGGLGLFLSHKPTGRRPKKKKRVSRQSNQKGKLKTIPLLCWLISKSNTEDKKKKWTQDVDFPKYCWYFHCLSMHVHKGTSYFFCVFADTHTHTYTLWNSCTQTTRKFTCMGKLPRNPVRSTIERVDHLSLSCCSPP